MEATTATDQKESVEKNTATTLNVMCGICFEFYDTSDHVYSTTCGHLFHDRCLFAALRNANSCPECRRPCSRGRVHPVFMNYGERTELDNQLNEAGWKLFANMPIWTPLFELEQHGIAAVPQLDEAIQCGTDPDGNPTYVARVYYQDDLLPASYVPEKKFAYASHGCHALSLSQGVELLNNCNHEWVADSNGHVPSNAIVAGYSELGEDLYVGRASYEGKTLLGKIHPSHKVMYMPYIGQEVNTDSYEVLVLVKEAKNTDTGTGSSANTNSNISTESV